MRKNSVDDLERPTIGRTLEKQLEHLKQAENGLTNQKVADRLGITYKALGALLHGRSVPRRSTLEDIFRVFHIPLDEQQSWRNLVVEERARRRGAGGRRTPPQTLIFIYPGVEEASAFWNRAATNIVKSVDKADLLGDDGDRPRFGITMFCHRERRSLERRHLKYANALGTAVAGVVLVPACGVSDIDRTKHSAAISEELDVLRKRGIPMVFLDRVMVDNGRPADLVLQRGIKGSRLKATQDGG